DVVGQVAPDAGGARDVRLAAQLALDADVARDAGDLIGEGEQGDDHVVDRLDQGGDLAAALELQLLLEVALGDRGDDPRDAAHLLGQVARHQVDVVGQLLPDAGGAAHLRLAAQHALGADLAGDAGDLGGERAELIDHRGDGVLEHEDLAADLDRDLARQVAVGDRGGDVGDVADLVGQ